MCGILRLVCRVLQERLIVSFFLVCLLFTVYCAICLFVVYFPFGFPLLDD